MKYFQQALSLDPSNFNIKSMIEKINQDQNDMNDDGDDE